MNPTRSPMCSPEIEIRCDRLDARSTSFVAWVIPARSPVIIADAKAPAWPGIAACIAWESRILSRKASSGRPPSGGRSASTGERV